MLSPPSVDRIPLCSICTKNVGQTMISVYRVLLVLSFIFCSTSALHYDLQEELPIGTVVGNVKIDANLTSEYTAEELPRLRFHLRSSVGQGHQRYFTVDERTGYMTLAHVIDREKLCPYSSVSCDPLAFEILVRPNDLYRVIKVFVNVVDINDNFPTFPKDTIILKVPETAASGTTFMIPGAEDADSGVFGVQEYRLLSEDDGTFQLVVTEQVDGAKDVRLKLVGRLDREKISNYQVVVLATDGGQPPKTGSLTVDIVVLDANDNSPHFENSTYEVEIREDLPEGSTLLRLVASDPDEGPNGEVRFSLADQTESAYGQIFGIDPESGDLYLRQSVDYEESKSFILTVQAKDMGSRSLTVFAKVIVNVLDVNDNRPVITVSVLTDSDFAKVPENSPPGTFVAHVAVKDADSGRNGQVQCSIDKRSLFDLKGVHSEFQIITTVAFDREEKADYDVTLTCRDKGEKPLTSSSVIQVMVLDENDNRPELGLSTDPFEFSVYENNRPNASIGKINATDRDEGRNSELVFRLQPLDGTPDNVLTVDPISGNVLARKSLDYEDRSEYRFLLTVTDRGDDPLSATSTLLLTILDSNDERPVFDRSKYFMTVRENQKPGAVVGRVNATDRDLNPEFRQISYTFSTPNGVFDIDEQSGQLSTLRPLDHEEQQSYRLHVVASNRGYPGVESKVNVTVFVEDDNDNAPVFLFPGGGVNTVELAGRSIVAGSVVTRLVATDRDAGQNAELIYGINSGNVENLFDIESTTGVITLARKPYEGQPSEDQTHKLVVIVKDRGTPQLLCVADLTVIFNNSQLASAHTNPGNSEPSLGEILLEGHNILILVGAALGFFIVVTCIVLAAVCVRRHRNKHDNNKGGGFAMKQIDSSDGSHRHCQSPSFSTRGSRSSAGGRGPFNSYEPSMDIGSRSAAWSLLQHHTCECEDGAMRDDETTYMDRIPADWPDLQQDSGIVENSDCMPVPQCDSGDVLVPPMTPSSASRRCHGVPRTRSFSPHPCCSHRCCGPHGNVCGGGMGNATPVCSRCRLYLSPTYRQQSLASSPHSPPEAFRMLPPMMKMPNQETSIRDHDLESVGSASTWTDSGRGPSEEDDRLRSLQVQPCLNCGSKFPQGTGVTDAVLS